LRKEERRQLGKKKRKNSGKLRKYCRKEKNTGLYSGEENEKLKEKNAGNGRRKGKNAGTMAEGGEDKKMREM
jgi:hypothetical protein